MNRENCDVYASFLVVQSCCWRGAGWERDTDTEMLLYSPVTSLKLSPQLVRASSPPQRLVMWVTMKTLQMVTSVMSLALWERKHTRSSPGILLQIVQNTVCRISHVAPSALIILRRRVESISIAYQKQVSAVTTAYKAATAIVISAFALQGPDQRWIEP